jgi:uncharacterized protein (DUF885 family)
VSFHYRQRISLSFALALLSVLPRAAAQMRSAPDRMLQSLFVHEWDYEMQSNPVWASLLGDRRWNDRWDDLSLEAITRDHQHDVAVLEQMKSINRARSPNDQLNYDLFRRLYQTWVDEYRFRWYLLPENQESGLPEGFHEPPGVQSAFQLADNLGFETSKDYQDWIARMQRFPAYVDQVIALMQQGIRQHMVHPKIIMQRLPEQVRKQLVTNPEESGFYKPFKKFPNSITDADQQQLAQQARAAISGSVLPALKKFEQFLTTEYIPAGPNQVGIWQMPQGEQMYAAFIRRETTTDLTPQQVHELGLAEVKRIRAEMEAVKQKAGFSGTLQDFFKFLRSDLRFYYHDPQELLLHYRNIAKEIDPRLVKLFRTLPRMPYGVEPTPAETAPDATTGFYFGPAADGSRAGTYFVNLYKPETRPTWEMTPLTLHEAVPGHHLQISLAMEQKDMPNFRRYGSYTAYVEGWALYAESLGDELGMYDDPYKKFGELAYEMWRAIRLVVDTGMHSMHWDRQRAIGYFLENSPRQELDVTNEIDRYIATPAQALAYKVGQLMITELRTRAQQQGEFDLREFHEVVLSSGAVPLDVLEKRVRAWMKTKESEGHHVPNIH